jgi:hypothetical protein
MEVLFGVTATSLFSHHLLEHLILLIQVVLLLLSHNLSWGVLHAVSLFAYSRGCNVLLSRSHLGLWTVFQSWGVLLLLLIFSEGILPFQLLLLKIIGTSILLKVLALLLLIRLSYEVNTYICRSSITLKDASLLFLGLQLPWSSHFTFGLAMSPSSTVPKREGSGSVDCWVGSLLRLFESSSLSSHYLLLHQVTIGPVMINVLVLLMLLDLLLHTSHMKAWVVDRSSRG